jgi:hypothetical protein
LVQSCTLKSTARNGAGGGGGVRRITHCSFNLFVSN